MKTPPLACEHLGPADRPPCDGCRRRALGRGRQTATAASNPLPDAAIARPPKSATPQSQLPFALGDFVMAWPQRNNRKKWFKGRIVIPYETSGPGGFLVTVRYLKDGQMRLQRMRPWHFQTENPVSPRAFFKGPSFADGWPQDEAKTHPDWLLDKGGFDAAQPGAKIMLIGEEPAFSQRENIGIEQQNAFSCMPMSDFRRSTGTIKKMDKGLGANVCFDIDLDVRSANQLPQVTTFSIYTRRSNFVVIEPAPAAGTAPVNVPSKAQREEATEIDPEDSDDDFSGAAESRVNIIDSSDEDNGRGGQMGKVSYPVEKGPEVGSARQSGGGSSTVPAACGDSLPSSSPTPAAKAASIGRAKAPRIWGADDEDVGSNGNASVRPLPPPVQAELMPAVVPASRNGNTRPTVQSTRGGLCANADGALSPGSLNPLSRAPIQRREDVLDRQDSGAARVGQPSRVEALWTAGARKADHNKNDEEYFRPQSTEAQLLRSNGAAARMEAPGATLVQAPAALQQAQCTAQQQKAAAEQVLPEVNAGNTALASTAAAADQAHAIMILSLQPNVMPHGDFAVADAQPAAACASRHPFTGHAMNDTVSSNLLGGGPAQPCASIPPLAIGADTSWHSGQGEAVVSVSHASNGGSGCIGSLSTGMNSSCDSPVGAAPESRTALELGSRGSEGGLKRRRDVGGEEEEPEQTDATSLAALEARLAAAKRAEDEDVAAHKRAKLCHESKMAQRSRAEQAFEAAQQALAAAQGEEVEAKAEVEATGEKAKEAVNAKRELARAVEVTKGLLMLAGK